MALTQTSSPLPSALSSFAKKRSDCLSCSLSCSLSRPLLRSVALLVTATFVAGILAMGTLFAIAIATTSCRKS
jgi:hypothetical protein